MRYCTCVSCCMMCRYSYSPRETRHVAVFCKLIDYETNGAAILQRHVPQLVAELSDNLLQLCIALCYTMSNKTWWYQVWIINLFLIPYFSGQKVHQIIKCTFDFWMLAVLFSYIMCTRLSGAKWQTTKREFNLSHISNLLDTSRIN